MTRLIHLNGPPGIGKSTLARRYVEEHPGVLNCDIDVLRTLIGSWSTDFVGAGELIRPSALAMIEAYLAGGNDVVLPQMLISPDELARFGACAERSGAQYVERFLVADAESAVARFGRRGESDPADPWHGQVLAIVAAQGGDEVLRRYHSALEDLLVQRPAAQAILSVEGDADDTYARLVASLD